MSVEFEEDNYTQQRYKSRVIVGLPATPSLSNFFVKIGIAKDTNQAYKLLIFITVISLVLAVVIYYFFTVRVGHSPIPASAIYENK